MRRYLVAAALAALSLAPWTANHASAQIITLTADLSGSNETPAPGLLTGSFGFAVVRLDTGAKSWSWDVDVFNLPSGLTNAHIHVAGAGVAARRYIWRR